MRASLPLCVLNDVSCVCRRRYRARSVDADSPALELHARLHGSIQLSLSARTPLHASRLSQFVELLAEGTYVDCFRHLWPDATGNFSYWSTRSGNQLLNRGLRLDYAVASSSVVTEVCDAEQA